MARVVPLQRQFSRGMKQDLARDLMPPGTCWNLVDFIPDILGAPLEKRGKWTNASSVGAGSYAAAAAVAEFSSGTQVVRVNNAGQLYSGGSLVTSTIATTLRPAFFANKLVLLKQGTTPVAYDGSSVAAISSAPTAAYGLVYKQRLVLLNDGTTTDGIWFSPVLGKAYTDTWQTDLTTGAILRNGGLAITGGVAMRNAILVFSTGHTTRIRGSVPPPSSSFDMTVEPLFDIGCIDARSIASFGENVIFANGQGVFMTDGAVPENLIEAGGLATYWLNLLSSWTSSWTLSAGIVRGHYVISIMNGSTFVDCLACHIDSRTWIRLSNIKASMMAQSFGASQELYFARRDSDVLAKLSTIFTPGALADDDGTDILPTLETGYFAHDANGRKRVRAIYMSADIRDPATHNPTLDLSWITSPDSTSYAALGAFTESTELDRQRVWVNDSSFGFALKLQQAQPSSYTRLYSIGADMHGREGSSLA